MNNMGSNTNLNNINTNGGFDPAVGNLTASERAEINRMNRNYYYSDTSLGHGCGNNSDMNMNMNNSFVPQQNWRNMSSNNSGPAQNWNSNQNNSMIVRPNNSNQVNNMRPTTTGTQSISFTPETLTNMSFLPAYLSQYIGHWVRADFFIGETIEQRVGVLHEVGASYFILEAIEPQTLLVCDMFSVKFVTIILDDDLSRLARF